MKRNGIVRLLAMGTVALAWFISSPADAQDPYRVRGKLTSVSLPSFEVQSADGKNNELMLGEESNTYVVTPGKLEEIDEGQFVGITSIDGADDRRVALEVPLFSEELRCVGEGNNPWDLVREPNMMTNATIAEIKKVEGGPMVTVTYAAGDNEQKSQEQQVIHVPPDIPVVQLAPRDPANLASGKDVFLLLKDDDAGKPIPLAVAEGVRPPM